MAIGCSRRRGSPPFGGDLGGRREEAPLADSNEGFIITGSGDKWAAKGSNEASEALGVAGGAYADVVKDIRTKVQATDAANPIRIGGGAVSPKSFFISCESGPAPAGGGGGGVAAGGGDAPAAEAKKEESEEGSDESMGGLFD